MDGEQVRIDHLHLRIPGLSPEEAERLAREVAGRLADRLGALDLEREIRLGALDLRLEMPPGASRETLVEMIVERVLGGVG